jgi:MbtH protein
VTIDDQAGETPDAFVIVVNDLGQHALWQTELDVPRGWRRQSPVMSRRQCLEAVEGSWKDIAPLTARAAPRGNGGRFVHERFADRAARRPDANAIVAGRTRMTYRELDESASRLAHYLAGVGVGPETGRRRDGDRYRRRAER